MNSPGELRIGVTQRWDRAAKAFVVAIAVLFLLLPVVNKITRLLPETIPRGERVAKSIATPTLDSFASGAWQRAFQDHVRKASPLRFPLLQLGDVLYLSIFGQPRSFTSGFPIALGNEDYLFRTIYLPEFNRTQEFDLAAIAKRLEQLKLLQDNLAKRGTRLLFLITPNLTSLYPELVPAKFHVPGRENRPQLYPEVKKLVEELQIKTIDTHALLLERQGDYPFRFFARSASHWNDVGSCISLAAANEMLWRMGGGFRRFDCSNWSYREEPAAKDRDLSTELNLAYPERFYDPTPYVSVSYTDPLPEKLPRVLAIGTSYLAAFMEHILRWDLSEDTLMYFYYRKQKVRGWKAFGPLRKEQIDWAQILSTDIIFINAKVGEFDNVGYGFIEDALSAGKQLGWW
jgi:hypothetical protein